MVENRAILRALGALLILITVLHAMRIYLEMETNSIDGAFQTYSAVSAYVRGERLGVDFQSYLGVLMPLAIVPIFVLLGQTVFAATFSAILLCCAGCYFTFLVLLRLTTRLAKDEAALWAMAATFLAIAGIRLWAFIVLPGVSLKALRFALPFFVALPTWALLQRQAANGRSPLIPPALLGVVIAIASLWSNDAGIPCLIAGIGVHAVLCLRTLDPARAAAAIATLMVSTLAAIIVILLALTHGAPGEWLHYTFVSMPADQPWLFPPWAPHERVLAIGDILHILQKPTGWTIALCGVTACVAIYRLWMRRGEAVPTAMVAFVYAATTGIGLLPQVAGHIDVGYGFGTIIPALFAPLWIVPRLGIAATQLLTSRWQAHIAFVLALIALIMIGASAHARLKRNQAYSPTIGAFTDPGEADTLAAISRARPMIARIAPDPRDRILSTYYSAVSIAAQAIPPTRYGSVIHVLGDDARADYVAKIRTTDFALVTTINPEFSDWAGWNLRASWFAIKPVVEGYEPFAKSLQHIFWKRREAPLPPASPLSCTVRALDKGIVELTITDIAGQPSPKGVWFVDASAYLSHPASLYWIATEVDASAERWLIARKQKGWYEFPSYGLPPKQRLSLMAEHVAGRPTRIRLKAIPGLSAHITGQCAATIFAPMPSVSELPTLNDRILHEALAPRLPRS
ncbi:hypothetical protein [Sphingomonas crocodyli]|uniref:Uncharacterized protein n=1 Tax=Sphingomonas crocodyli TaxID=1979270 RepID=A0A437M852_9SPHN|nr:hypothetical protein [Sphingomonas crocodyli]RVT93891.1 hypothetical protein EOD43_08525 [Sphingomonas crocodyli]